MYVLQSIKIDKIPLPAKNQLKKERKNVSIHYEGIVGILLGVYHKYTQSQSP